MGERLKDNWFDSYVVCYSGWELTQEEALSLSQQPCEGCGREGLYGWEGFRTMQFSKRDVMQDWTIENTKPYCLDC